MIEPETQTEEAQGLPAASELDEALDELAALSPTFAEALEGVDRNIFQWGKRASDPSIDYVASGSTSPQKMELWAQYQAGEITKDDLIEGAAHLIAQERPSGEGEDHPETYWEHYSRSHERAWDKSHENENVSH